MKTLDVKTIHRGQLTRQRSTNNNGDYEQALPAVDQNKDNVFVIQPAKQTPQEVKKMKKKKKPSWMKNSKKNFRVVWPHVKWALINLGYLGFGAMMMSVLDTPLADVRYQAHRQVLLDTLRVNASTNTTFKEWQEAVSEEFLKHQDIVMNARLAWVYGTNTSQYLVHPARAFFLAFVVVTTIGYGHSTPQTPGGRVFLIFYAMFGIPMMITWVSDVGALLDTLLRYLVGKIKARACSKKESEFDSAPAWVIILLLAVYLLLGAVGLSAWENWNLLDSIYYLYITVTSVGFGDFVPTNQLNVVLALPYVMVGMALASMLNGITGEKIIWLSAKCTQVLRRPRGRPCPCCGLANARALRPEDIVRVKRVALKWRDQSRESAIRRRQRRAQLLPVRVVWDDVDDPDAPDD